MAEKLAALGPLRPDGRWGKCPTFGPAFRVEQGLEVNEGGLCLLEDTSAGQGGIPAGGMIRDPVDVPGVPAFHWCPAVILQSNLSPSALLIPACCSCVDTGLLCILGD